MKIFNRGTEPAKAAQPAQAPAPAAAQAKAPAAPPSPPPAQAAPAGPPTPDITAIIEANVKEMSEKIAKLANSVEGGSNNRTDLESKLERMEERMRKLSSLTEMISAQYNPFVGAAPSEREALPAPDVGLAAPAQVLSLPPPPPPAPVEAEAPALDIPLEDSLASAAAALAAPPLEEMVSIEVQAAHAPEFEEEQVDFSPPPERPALALPDDARDFRLWSARPSFESSMLMLNWADLLLRNAPNRESFDRLVDYYHNIGWLGQPARDQLLAYADGIKHAPAASDAPAGDWRPSSEVHEKSLLFIEKLRAIQEGKRGY